MTSQLQHTILFTFIVLYWSHTCVRTNGLKMLEKNAGEDCHFTASYIIAVKSYE